MLSMCSLHSTIFLELKTGGDSESFIITLKQIRIFPFDTLNFVPVSEIFQKNSSRPGPFCLLNL